LFFRFWNLLGIFCFSDFGTCLVFFVFQIFEPVSYFLFFIFLISLYFQNCEKTLQNRLTGTNITVFYN